MILLGILNGWKKIKINAIVFQNYFVLYSNKYHNIINPIFLFASLSLNHPPLNPLTAHDAILVVVDCNSTIAMQILVVGLNQEVAYKLLLLADLEQAELYKAAAAAIVDYG